MSINIQLTNTGKRFNRHWIFRKINYTFLTGNTYAIIGPNGSGKSTLLQVIAGSTNTSSGSIQYYQPNNMQAANNQQSITTHNIYQHIAIVAPYLDVIDEMTATEFLQFHATFKPLTHTVPQIIALLNLQNAAHQQIRYYSSGMRQRIKLAQAIFTQAPILLLDEPCTNLDKTGYALYHQLIQNHCANKLVIVSSNDDNEISFCKHKINIMDWK